MPSELIAILGTLSGVLVGGLVNFLSTRATKDREWRLGIDRELLLIRNRSYTDFLNEFDEQYQRLGNDGFPTIEERARLKSKVNAMSFCSGTPVLISANSLRKALHAPQRETEDSILKLKDTFLLAATRDLNLMTGHLPSRS